MVESGIKHKKNQINGCLHHDQDTEEVYISVMGNTCYILVLTLS